MGGGSHGSCSKAGKVRKQTPFTEVTTHRKSKIPRVTRLRNYEKHGTVESGCLGMKKGQRYRGRDY